MLSEAARYNYIMSWYVILNYEPLPEAVINYDSCRNSAQLVMPKSQADHFYTMERRATAHVPPTSALVSCTERSSKYS